MLVERKLAQIENEESGRENQRDAEKSRSGPVRSGHVNNTFVVTLRHLYHAKISVFIRVVDYVYS